MESQSLWQNLHRLPEGDALTANLNAEVCIVGAGIAGLTTAYELVRDGRKVVLLDEGKAGSGQTHRSSAHLANAIDDRYFEIERLHGEAGARLAADSHTAAINFIETTVQDLEIDCHFRRVPGYLFLGPGQAASLLDRELAACHRAGLTEVRKLESTPIPSLSARSCLLFPNQAQFDPIQYLISLNRAFQKLGGKFFSGVRVHEVIDGAEPMVKTTDGLEINADKVVVATNSPINDRYFMHTKQAAYRTYVIAFKTARNAVPIALYWDTLDPYHYVRVHQEAGEEFLIVGGEDHKTGQSTDEMQAYENLENWAREIFPAAGKIAYRWSGQVEETIDGLAFIGKNPLDKNVFIVTGDSGMGLTHGTIAGQILSDLVQNRDNSWAKLYDPARKNLRALGKFITENVNVALQYRSLITPGEVESIDEIELGSGAIMRRGLKKVAIYRNENGGATEVSAICPHLGAVLSWNSAEKTWDCPCHGSRFSTEGKVLEGPAVSDLPLLCKHPATRKKAG